MKCIKCLKNIDKKSCSLHGLHRNCFKQWFDLPKISDFSDIALQTSIESSGPQGTFSDIGASFLQGKFKKYTAQLNGHGYILKMQQAAYPDLPAMEYVCNQIAEHLKLPIPPFYLIQFNNEVMTFVTKNFAFEMQAQSLTHLYHFFSKKQPFNCENIIRIIERESQQTKDVENFICLCLFDALIGNHDRHGRNLGFLESYNRVGLAPFYDNPSYLGIEEDFLLEAQHEPRGRIATTKNSNPTMMDYLIEFKQLGYHHIVKTFFNHIAMASIEQCIDNSFMSLKRKKAFKKLINHRYGVMKDALL